MDSTSPIPNDNDDYNDLFKLVIIGDSSVGKTHLLHKFVKNQPPKNVAPTIGVEFATKTVTLKDGGKVKAQIWDTAGQERYRSITSAHYRKAVGALLVYDITKEKAFESVSKWMEDLKLMADPDIVIVLVGNKLDLVEKNDSLRKVSKDTAENFAKDHKLLFQETSAMTSAGVNEAFERLLLELIYNKSKKEGTSTGHKLNQQQVQDGNCVQNC